MHRKSMFAKFGIPHNVISDDGPEFKAHIKWIKIYLQRNGFFHHDISSTLYSMVFLNAPSK